MTSEFLHFKLRLLTLDFAHGCNSPEAYIQ